MHSAEREEAILKLLRDRGFIAFRELEKRVPGSPATLRRDLERLAKIGLITRVHGGARLVGENAEAGSGGFSSMSLPEGVGQNRDQKEAIGRAAAGLCKPGEAVMIHGGSTTLQMCPHLDGLNLQVLTNSLHVLSALLPQSGTRISMPGGAVFREQSVIIAGRDSDLMPGLYAPKLFMGATAVGPHGLMQADPVILAAESMLIERAEELVLLVDSSKFELSSGNVLCELDKVDVVVTDRGVSKEHLAMLKKADIRVVIAE